MLVYDQSTSIDEENSFLFSDKTSIIDQCFIEDYEIIDKIQKSEKEVSIGNQSYAYYELINDESYLYSSEQLTIEKAWEPYYKYYYDNIKEEHKDFLSTIHK